jgi:adenine-specific DNA-methyltransferase
MTDLEKLQKEIQKLKKENADLKKKKKFGLVWEEREREVNIDDGEYYPYLVKKGNDFGFDNGDNNKNILIEGDNYHALEILQYTHKGKIDVIYIDPPYNIDKDLKYGDRWISKEDGYRHSYWLSFMEKRLTLAKELLNREGVICISIDDNEYARLKLMCDDIFAASNFIGVFTKKIGGGKNDSKTIKVNHEYLLCYGKSDKSRIKLKDEVTIKDTTATLQKWGDTEERENRENLWYPIYANIKTKEIFFEFKDGLIEILPIKNDGTERYWRWERDTAIEDVKKLCLVKGKDDFDNVKYDIHVLTPKGTRKQLPWSSFIPEFSTGGGSKLTEVLRRKIPKMYPKNLEYIKWICSLSTKENPLVLDFFAGSGTTAHALMELINDENSHIGSHSRYILVTNNENDICEDVCYRRVENIVNGYSIKRKDKTIEIPPINSNLEYLKLETLKYDDKKHSELDIKDFMVDKLLEILKVKEMCFSLKRVSDFLYKFNKENKDVYILLNIYNMSKKDYEDVKELLEQSPNSVINIYILSLQNHTHYENKLSDINKQIIFEPLPENFLKLLRKIQRKKR